MTFAYGLITWSQRSAAIVAVLVTAAAFAGGVDEQAEIALIRKMEDIRIQAGVRKDTDVIAAATADDYVQIDLDGKVFDKASAMQRIRSSQIRLQSNRVEDMTVRIYGNTAVVTGRATPKGVIDGAEFPPVRYSRVYIKRDQQWKVVMFQMTRIAPDRSDRVRAHK